MDVALCSLEGDTLSYAGALTPLCIIRNGEVLATRANREPIEKFAVQSPYITHKFKLWKGDSIYIFSDGYAEQFGGAKGKKFTTKPLRELLRSINAKSMEEQRLFIDEAVESWRGGLEQIDAVCVIGVRIWADGDNAIRSRLSRVFFGNVCVLGVRIW
jgi:serine phosphatase RsbU (regulator of sigma subunit)